MSGTRGGNPGWEFAFQCTPSPTKGGRGVWSPPSPFCSAALTALVLCSPHKHSLLWCWFVVLATWRGREACAVIHSSPLWQTDRDDVMDTMLWGACHFLLSVQHGVSVQRKQCYVFQIKQVFAMLDIWFISSKANTSSGGCAWRKMVIDDLDQVHLSVLSLSLSLNI